MNIDLSYYLSVFLRRLPIFLVVSVAVTAAAVYVAMILPPMYSANAQLLVESPQIPTNLAASTVTTDAEEQLTVLQRRLMTRENLLDIARKYDVVATEDDLTPDEIVERMRERTSMYQRGRGGTTIMYVGFSSEQPKVAAAVANDYVTRIMEETLEIRKGLAGNTLQFFEDEVDRLGVELDRKSASITEFKRQNSGALPDSLDYRMRRQSDQQERLTQINRELLALRDQRESVIGVYESGGRLRAGTDALTPEERQLRELQDQLQNALAVYSPSNPKVRLLQTRVERLEEQVAAGQDTASEDPRETILNMQLAEIDARQEYLTEQQETIEAELARLEESIARTPENAIALGALERDYSNLQGQYNAAVGRLATAATGERIEVLSKGERVTVLEQATVPVHPNSPDRLKIAGMGGVAGVGLGVGLIALLELLNQSIRRPVDLQKGLGIAPLATLPYLRTRRETMLKRLLVIAAILVVIVGAPALVYAVHTYYMPLDLLFERVLEQLL